MTAPHTRARSAVHELTREHLTHTPGGNLLYAPALLEQLTDAVTPGATGPASASAGLPVPVNLSAVVLYQEINAVTREAAAEMHGLPVPGTLPDVLRAVPELLPAYGEEWASWWANVLERWTGEIRTLLSPPPPRRTLPDPCPACGQSTHTVWDASAGEDVRKPALSVAYRDAAGAMLPPAEWDAACAACEATWQAGPEMSFFVRAITAQQQTPDADSPDPCP